MISDNDEEMEEDEDENPEPSLLAEVSYMEMKSILESEGAKGKATRPGAADWSVSKRNLPSWVGSDSSKGRYGNGSQAIGCQNHQL